MAMFKINPNPTFSKTVDITVPGGASQPLDVVFKHKKKSELKEFIEGMRGRNDALMLQEMVSSVSGKPEGQSDSDFLADLIENYPAALSDLIVVYLREHTESRLKN